MSKSEKKLTTSFTVEEKLWRDFSGIIAAQYGNRMISDVLGKMIRGYVDSHEKHPKKPSRPILPEETHTNLPIPRTQEKVPKPLQKPIHEPEPEPKNVPKSVNKVNKVNKINKPEPEPKPEPAKIVKNVEPEPELSNQELRSKVIEIIRTRSGRRGAVDIDVYRKAKEEGIEKTVLDETIQWLIDKGRIYEPSIGLYLITGAKPYSGPW